MHGGTITQRPLVHRVGVVGAYWISCDELVLEHDRARRDREVAADLERASRRSSRCGRGRTSATRLASPCTRLAAVGRERRLEHLGIGRDEIGRRDRVDVLARHEREPLLVVVGQAARRGELAQVVAVEQVALLEPARTTAARATRGASKRRSPGAGSTTDGSARRPWTSTRCHRSWNLRRVALRDRAPRRPDRPRARAGTAPDAAA